MIALRKRNLEEKAESRKGREKMSERERALLEHGVRAWVRELDHATAERTARQALSLGSAAEVERLVAPLVVQAGDAAAQHGDGRAGVVTVGPQA